MSDENLLMNCLSVAVSCVRVMVSGQVCQSDGQAVSGVSQ